jgi:excisionase family DNA binding protein
MSESTSATGRARSLVEPAMPRPDLVRDYLRLSPEERRRLFITTRQAAHQVGTAQRTVQSWINEGKLEAIRLGGRYLVHAESLARLIRVANEGE